jgi:hypothetical protein
MWAAWRDRTLGRFTSRRQPTREPLAPTVPIVEPGCNYGNVFFFGRVVIAIPFNRPDEEHRGCDECE